MLNLRPWYSDTSFSIAKAYQRGMRIHYTNNIKNQEVDKVDKKCTTIQKKPNITYFLLYPYS